MGKTCDIERIRQEMERWYAANGQKTIDISKSLWDNPEIAFEEVRSAALLSGWLEENDFTVERGVAGIPTAFVASYTNGDGPVIGILAEYDALPGMGHEISTERKPTGGNGHGCGHNLFGAGSVSAAIAVRSIMDATGIRGTVRLFGCPAEENGGAKVFMVRDGVFDGVDAVLTWHPAHANLVTQSSSKAAATLEFSFHGVAAHPGTSAHLGRSAVEAIEVMEVALGFLRAHMQTGWTFRTSLLVGEDEGIGFPEAGIVCHLRAAKRQDLDAFAERVIAAANGAAIATGTTVDLHRGIGFSNSVMNDTLSRRALENLKRVGGPEFTEEDYALAKGLNETIPLTQKRGMMGFMYHLSGEMADGDLYPAISEDMMRGTSAPYTGDGGDVTWNVPTCTYNIACQTIGSANHSWQQVVCSGTHIGQAGMICAAKSIALSAADFMDDPALLTAARAEFDAMRAEYPYTLPIDADTKPF